ncbi:mucin-4 isoform X2 [Motacilla alba alba]|uniref:mucin-4 isoform X2 n=1 Tax=Motacilla alba alba TaxID=1094192 RepID=UPI0018D4EC1F|nr:mucin-4 isoform X2 [Motacilla alba alba]
MGRPWPLWSWLLWGLWVLPAGEMKGQPFVPTSDPSESGSVSHVADSTSAELPSDLAMCQELPRAAAARAELPSAAGPTTAPAGSQGSGIPVPQAKERGLVPAGSSGEQEGPPSPAALSGGPAMPGSPQAGSGAGLSSAGTASHPSSIPPAPTTTWHMQPLSSKPTGPTVGLALDAVTAEQLPVTARTTEPLLPQNEHSTATSSPSISGSSAEPHSTAMLLSQEVILGLDEATLPLATAASISQDRASPMKMAAAAASPPDTAAEGAFSSTTTGTSKAAEPGTCTLPNTDHNASQDPPGPPTQLPPALLPQLPDEAVLSTGETLPPSHSAAPGTAGHGLPAEHAVSQPQATTQAAGTRATVTDVVAGEHIPPLGSTSAEQVSIRNEASTKATAGTAIPETKDTPGGLSMSLSPYAALKDPDGPSLRPFPRSMGSLLPQSLSTGLGTTTAEAAAGSSPPATPSMAVPLSLLGTTGAKPDRAPRAAAAAPPPSIAAFGIGTVPATHPSSFVSNSPISEARMGSASLASGSATTMPGDTEATLPVPDAHSSHSQPAPTAGSTTPGTGVTPRSALTPVLWAGPQIVEAPGTEMPPSNTAPGTGRAVSDTLGGPRAVTVPMASQADVPPVLEGGTNVGMALEVSPSSIPQEVAPVTSPLSLAAPLQAMGPSGDPQPNGSTTGQAMGMGFLEVSTEENPGASAAGPAPSHTIVTARPSPEPPATENKLTAGITSLAVGHTNVWEATAASQTGATGTAAHEDTTSSEGSTEGAAPSANTSSTRVPDSNASGTSLATTPATTPSTSTFPSNANLPTPSTGCETFVTTAMPPATALTSSAPSLAVTRSETSRGGQPVPSPAARTPVVDTTLGSVSGSPLPSLHSPAQEATTAPLSLLGVGATGVAAAGQTPTESATGTTSTSIGYHDMGQAASTSPPALQTSPGAPAWKEKTAISTGSATATAAGNSTATTATTAGSTTATTAITAGSTTAITGGYSTATTAGSTTATSAGNTTAFTADSTTATTGGYSTATTAGSTTATTAGKSTATTAGNITATAATTATAAGNTTAITPDSTTAITGGYSTATTATTAGNIAVTTATTAGGTTAIASTAPASPAKEAGSLPGTTAPVTPPATTSPATTLSHAFGTQRGPSTELSTSAHTTTGHRTPAPEPQPTHELIKPATSLYPFGVEGGDQEYVRRMVDFNSPLFKPEIGFPFGKSLRDALYFTDNGQIIFPPTDNYVPSNPNPPPRGFTGRESLPMVAAFWDDADFSKGVGTTWYQEYSTLSSTQDPVVKDVEAKIEKYLKIPYVAKWTLKVTWEKAPAYPSRRDDTQTSTYQAVLSTDGSRSFALLLYQDGGMRWDYSRLAAANVLIGFSSGNGHAQNNNLTQKPPAVKYRPDQHSSTGFDVRGLWIYRLDTRSRVNYRLQCLAWLDTEPAPATWNSQLPPCPCSRPQAELDPRYHWSRGPADTSVRMLRTASPSPAGAGVRCLYQGGSLLEGWQERTWSLPFHAATDTELEVFDWCCRRVGKPLFCARFAEKRPRVGCEGYVPPTPAGAFGDPHITTLDGLTYTFNGLGDFVLLLASDAQTSFVLHGRTAQTGTAQATNFVAFAAQYTSNTTTTVEWTLGNQDDIQVLLNNKTIQFSYSQGPSLAWALPLCSPSLADLGDEVYYSPGVLLVNASSVTAIFDGTIAVSVSATSGILSVVCSLPDCYRNSTRGLLGVWDHDPADDFQMPNGTSIPVNSSEEEIYSYGMTWAVGEHSLFTQPLDSPALNFTPFFLSRLRQENESQYQLVASQCHSSKECIYDSLSTGNLALGLATQSLAADFQQKKTALNAFPPVITGDASITAFRTERVRRQFHALGEGAHFIPHLSPELNISENGTLVWEPRGIAPFTINLEAVGSNNISALLQLRFTLCRCSRSQDCDYSNTVTLRESSLQLAACRCESGYSGALCQDPPDPCSQGCFPGVGCDPFSGCGPCPVGLTGDGEHCSDIDECAQGTECPGNSTCTNTVGSYVCSCLASEQGEKPGCGLACGYHSCPEGYCSNGGHCHLHPITCVPTCTCPPAFTDQHCLVAGGDFQPLPSSGLPRRSIQMRMKTLQKATAEEVNSTVSAILDSLVVKAFQSNTNVTQMTDSDGFTFVVVSEFAYDSRGTVIRFLNEELPSAITGAFNGRRGRREAGTALLFQRLHRDNITDLVKLTVDELRDYFPCSLYGYKGYQLHYMGTIGFICISPCKMGYCQHGGQCQHLPEGPTCSCLPFSIYSPAGLQCEWLAISLPAFLGILLGALALLCLLFAMACLALRLCHQRRRHQGAKETFWRTRPFSSLTMAEEQAEATVSHSLERHWKLQLQAIDPSVQIRFQRPHVMPPSQSPQQP